jgi:hypothetical protein
VDGGLFVAINNGRKAAGFAELAAGARPARFPRLGGERNGG